MLRKLICNNECEAYLDNLFNSLDEGILLSGVIYDNSGEAVDFTVLEVNKAFEKVFGTRTCLKTIQL